MEISCSVMLYSSWQCTHVQVCVSAFLVSPAGLVSDTGMAGDRRTGPDLCNICGPVSDFLLQGYSIPVSNTHSSAHRFSIGKGDITYTGYVQMSKPVSFSGILTCIRTVEVVKGLLLVSPIKLTSFDGVCVCIHVPVLNLLTDVSVSDIWEFICFGFVFRWTSGRLVFDAELPPHSSHHRPLSLRCMDRPQNHGESGTNEIQIHFILLQLVSNHHEFAYIHRGMFSDGFYVPGQRIYSHLFKLKRCNDKMPFTNTAKGGWNATTWLSADWFYQNCLFVMNEQYRPYKSNKNTILLWNSKIKVGGLSALDLSCHEWLLCSTCWLQGENLPPIPVHVSCAFSSRTLFFFNAMNFLHIFILSFFIFRSL